jgi:DNA-binding NtrC family response regulator
LAESLPKLRVLVADDDIVIASTWSQILRLSGYDAESVCSGEEAIDAARRRPPDVLISDVFMGGINGIETANRILEIQPECVVILISGQANTSPLLNNSLPPGFAFEILIKPIRPEILLDRIATIKSEGGLRVSPG